MASTALEKKKARDYYRKNKKYREEKIEQRKEMASKNKKKEAEYSKKYYWDNPTYRTEKKKQAREYKKKNSKKK